MMTISHNSSIYVPSLSPAFMCLRSCTYDLPSHVQIQFALQYADVRFPPIPLPCIVKANTDSHATSKYGINQYSIFYANLKRVKQIELESVVAAFTQAASTLLLYSFMT